MLATSTIGAPAPIHNGGRVRLEQINGLLRSVSAPPA